MVDRFFVARGTVYALALDELNGFMYYCNTGIGIIKRATLKGENITDILDLGPTSTFPGHMPGRVCNAMFLLVLYQCSNAYSKLFK